MKMKKIRGGGGDQGGCVQRMEVIVKSKKKMKKTKRNGHSGQVGEAFEKIKNNFFLFIFLGGGGGGVGRGGGRVRELKGEVKLL